MNVLAVRTRFHTIAAAMVSCRISRQLQLPGLQQACTIGYSQADDKLINARGCRLQHAVPDRASNWRVPPAGRALPHHLPDGEGDKQCPWCLEFQGTGHYLTVTQESTSPSARYLRSGGGCQLCRPLKPRNCHSTWYRPASKGTPVFRSLLPSDGKPEHAGK